MIQRLSSLDTLSSEFKDVPITLQVAGFILPNTLAGVYRTFGKFLICRLQVALNAIGEPISRSMFKSIWLVPAYYVITILAVVPSHGLEHHLNNVKNPLLLLMMAFTAFMILMHPFVILSEGLSYLIVAFAAPAHARASLIVGGLIKFGVSTVSCVAAWWFMFTYVIEPR